MSCLFDSINYFVKEKDIRKIICDYLQDNKPIIDGLETKDILEENYIEDMRKPTTMGGAIEIQCACNIWRCRINVIYNSKIIEFLPFEQYDKTFFIIWNGNHYDPQLTFV